MTENVPPVNTAPQQPAGFDALVARREIITICLFVIGLAALALPIYVIVSHTLALAWSSPVFYWGVFVCLLSLIAGVLSLPSASNAALSPAERLRLVVLGYGALLGLSSAVLGLALVFTTEYQTVYSEAFAKWREKPGAVGWPALALVGGLTLTFLSLQLARGMERSSGLMRRMLYGFNAVFGSLLLLLILGLVNLLAYLPMRPFNLMSKTFDWTASGMYTLTDDSRNFISKLDQPIKVYALGFRESSQRELAGILEGCRSANPQVTWEALSPDENPLEVAAVFKKYKLPEAAGVLVVYGKDPDETWDFIEVNDLFEETPTDSGKRAWNFLGENAIIRSLIYLSEGKAKVKVYFLQGNGELEMSNSRANRKDEGLGVLVGQLALGNFEPKELRLDPTTPKVPEDAEVVVIARPRNALSPASLDALRSFVQGRDRKMKGKLIVLLDVVVEQGRMVQTGLESLLSELNVRVGNDHILAANGLDPSTPTVLVVDVNLDAMNTLAQRGRMRVQFDDARTVSSAAEMNPHAPPGGANVEPLAVVDRRQLIWAETDLNKDAFAVVRDLRQNHAELGKKISQRSLQVGVTVSEPKAGAPMNPHDFQGPPQTPRMVVFGDASWISNMGMSPGTGSPRENFELFSGCISWLREKPYPPRQVDPKKREEFVVKAPPENYSTMVVLPAALILLGVTGLGLGVWVVRRR